MHRSGNNPESIRASLRKRALTPFLARLKQLTLRPQRPVKFGKFGAIRRLGHRAFRRETYESRSFMPLLLGFGKFDPIRRLERPFVGRAAVA